MSGTEKTGAGQTPEAPQQAAVAPVSGSTLSVAPSGARQAFEDVLKPLTTDELASPGTQKLVLYMLHQAQAKGDQLDGYVERFHEADKRAAIFQERNDAQTRLTKAVEIAVITGTTLGGVLMGLAGYFWGKTTPDTSAGWFALIIGLGLLIGAIGIKIAKR